MGALSSLKSSIKQTLAEWDQADQQHGETKMKKQAKKAKAKTEVKTEVKSVPRSSLSQQLLAYIQVHPGVTGTALREIVRERSPKTPISYVPALLKGLFDSKFVRRTEVKADRAGRSTFAYYVLTEEERVALLSGTAKSKKNSESADTKGITALVPAKRIPMPTVEELGSTPATMISVTALNGAQVWFSVEDARHVYNSLNQIFGATR